MKTVLTISGSDPTGGAGLQADIQVFRSLGLHGAGIVTALTVQDSARVHQVLPVFPSVALEQIRTLLNDITPAAVKIGMLGSDDVVRNVMLGLADLDPAIPIVIDPVLMASDRTPLLERRAWKTLDGLFQRATLVTPNLFEAEALTGVPADTREGSESAARAFVEDLGAGGVLIKGGHREGAPDDLLAVAGASGLALHWLAGSRTDRGPVHGTGCALASAIAAHLALGANLERAVDEGRRYVAAGIEHAFSPGKGAHFLGRE